MGGEVGARADVEARGVKADRAHAWTLVLEELGDLGAKPGACIVPLASAFR